MLTSSISLETLVCRSVFEPDLLTGPVNVISIGGDRMEVTRVRNVLYLPDLRLQVINQRYVPLEGILVAWYVTFEQGRHFQGLNVTYQDQFAVTTIDADVCILGNLYSKNFGHWAEELLKVVVMEESGFRGLYVLGDLPRYCVDYIELLGIARGRLITELKGPTQFSSAVYGTVLSHQSLRFTGVIRRLRDSLWAATGTTRTLPTTRAWVDRGSNKLHENRELVNREEVESYLEQYGFVAVDFGSLSAAEQVALDKEITVLAGPHGAAFVHAGFMRDNCDVIECFSPLYLNPSIFGLCHALQHRYHMLVPHNSWIPYEHERNVLVDCDHLRLVLDAL